MPTDIPSAQHANARGNNNPFQRFFRSNQHPSSSQGPPADLELGATNLEPSHPTSHERQTSARSLLSQVSLPSLAVMRQRDREAEMFRQIARAETNRPPSPTPAELEAGFTDAQAAGVAATAMSAQPSVIIPSAATNTRPSAKTLSKIKREREEAATLFGPTLATYFGSGNSSSGAVSGANATPATPDPETAVNQASALARKARLGSRGRARGASLSGLGTTSLRTDTENLAYSYADVLAQSPSLDSTGELVSRIPNDVDPVAMNEGVDLETVKRWIDKSTGIYTIPSSPDLATITGPPICTTLQSFVNFKRNTTKLSLNPTNQHHPHGTALYSPLAPLTQPSDTLRASSSDLNLLRTRPSLSVLPSLSKGQPKSPAEFSRLPNPTHNVYFEYDCAAPYASVQVFVRASRKHGSWANFVPPSAGLPETLADGSPAMLAQKGPPPHVLGWPVHVAKLKKGFGMGHSASIVLDLKYYAPPASSQSQVNNDSLPRQAPLTDDTSQQFDSNLISNADSLLPETPAWGIQRRLELEQEEQEEISHQGSRRNRTNASGGTSHENDPTSESRPDATSTIAVSVDNVNDTNPNQETTAASEPVVETKDQKLSREKSERETLKVAIIVEALDENARPLREPNLQTTYLRVTSLPSRKPTAGPSLQPEEASPASEVSSGQAEPDAKPERIWSAQVEGQEAEIGPHRFQLQELYGLSSRPPPVRPAPIGGEEGEGDEDGETATAGNHPLLVSTDMEGSNGTECLICLSSPPTTLLLPCTHGLCLECAVQLRESVLGIRQSERRRGRTPKRKYACPVCRRGYTSMLHLSKAEDKLLAQLRGSSVVPPC